MNEQNEYRDYYSEQRSYDEDDLRSLYSEVPPDENDKVYEENNPYFESLTVNTSGDTSGVNEEQGGAEQSSDGSGEERRKLLLPAISMQELYDTSFSERAAVIKGFLHRGLYLFVGSAKIGKSFFMAQLAYSVSTGKPLWEGYDTAPGKVLYLALEDDYKRLQTRFYKMVGETASDNLFLCTQSQHMGDGLEQQLQDFIDKNKDTRLIIIDTLKKIRSSGGDGYSYDKDYDFISGLKEFADKNEICILIVHHSRKEKADDIFNMISGTNGLMASADGAFIMTKPNRTSDDAVIYVVGRDQQDQKYYLKRNTETLAWELERTDRSDDQDGDMNKNPDQILICINSIVNTIYGGAWYGSPTELKELVGLDIPVKTLTTHLNLNSGRLLEEYGIIYEAKRIHEGRRISLYNTGQINKQNAA